MKRVLVPFLAGVLTGSALWAVTGYFVTLSGDVSGEWCGQVARALMVPGAMVGGIIFVVVSLACPPGRVEAITLLEGTLGGAAKPCPRRRVRVRGVRASHGFGGGARTDAPHPGDSMKSFAVSAIIRATPEAVWAILADGAQWTTWNPTVEKVEGPITPGGKLRVYTTLSPGRAFPVRVSEFDPPRRMVWTGGMPLGLFKGVRTYALTPRDGGVEFSMTEVFSGLLAPLITRSIPDLQPSFVEFAAALKTRAERGAGPGTAADGGA